MDEQVKPCDVPCPKCGSAEVHRVFHARDSKVPNSDYHVSKHPGFTQLYPSDHLAASASAAGLALPEVPEGSCAVGADVPGACPGVRDWNDGRER